MRSSQALALVSVLLAVGAHGSEERECDRASESCQLDDEGPQVVEVMQKKKSISTDAIQSPEYLKLFFQEVNA
eukprot:s448_g19.t1